VLCALAATEFAFANTVAADNLKWSTTRVAAWSAAPKCTAHTNRHITQSEEPDAKEIALKVLAFSATSLALSKVGHPNGGVPDPCRVGF
jgi:hypothetical protein